MRPLLALIAALFFCVLVSDVVAGLLAHRRHLRRISELEARTAECWRRLKGEAP